MSWDYVRGVWDIAGNLPSSGKAEETPVFVANNYNRLGVLETVQFVIGYGEIRPFETPKGKIMRGLFLTNQEWVYFIDTYLEFSGEGGRSDQLKKLRNSLLMLDGVTSDV